VNSPEAGPETVLSVIMPNYNHAEYLSTALTAILAQKVLPDEIIIIDDGSTDDSRALIESWMSREARVRGIFNDSNRGAIARINQGLQAARGRYVCLMAADDMAYPNFFSEAIAALDKAPDAALFCAEAHIQSMDLPQRRPEVRPVIRPSHNPKSFSPAEARDILRYNDNFVTPIAAVFRRSMILAEGGFDPDLGSMADSFLSKRLALKYGFCFSPEIVARWQVRGIGLSRTNTRDPISVRVLLEKAQKRFGADPVFPPDYSETFNRRWRFATCRIALTTVPPDWDFVREIGPGTVMDRTVFWMAQKSGSRISGYLALFWLAVRYRPYSVLAMAETFAHRRWEMISKGR
jgi:glycosyltransferase involved in cell wall biosynthesis